MQIGPVDQSQGHKKNEQTLTSHELGDALCPSTWQVPFMKDSQRQLDHLLVGG